MPSVPSPFPSCLEVDVSTLPKLSREQAGHLRHFYNLSAAPDGEWPHMGTQEPDQAFLDAYRYQLATMAYAAGLAHYHHLPLMRSLFKPLIRRLIHKMLRRDVWSYWYLTSQSGIRLDPDLEELRKPWADPIVKENIMYSGHLLLMTSLYAMLFDDDEFEKPGSLTFDWSPLFWGMGPEKFVYNNSSLQDAILKEMERTGWAGVCCEPNLVFVVCNQFPIIAMRYNDIRHGTNVVDGVLQKYWAAIKAKQMIAPDGLFVNWLLVRQQNTSPPQGVGFTAWANAFMNTWNSEFVRSAYQKQSMGFITQVSGKFQIQHPAVGTEIRRLVTEEGASPNSPQTIRRAYETFLEKSGGAAPINGRPAYMQPLIGYVVKWLSELGKEAELDAILADTDDRFNPTWEIGGLFYPRNEQILDDEGVWTFMDPFSGNAAIGYSRLNVEDGQKKMWEHPWTGQELRTRPWVDVLEFCHGVDCLRGHWNGKFVIITLKSWNGRDNQISFKVKNLSAGEWGVYEGKTLIATYEIDDGGCVEIEGVADAHREVDYVILKGNSFGQKFF